MKLVFVTFLASLLVSSILFWMGPRDIVQLEVASEPAGAQLILKDFAHKGWDEGRVRAQLKVDFLFILAYVSFVWAACRRASGFYSTPVLAGLASILSWAQLLAGALDALENVALLRFLSANSQEHWLKISLWSALAKFVLLCLGLLIAGVGFLAGKHGARSKVRCVVGVLLFLLGLLVIVQVFRGLGQAERARRALTRTRSLSNGDVACAEPPNSQKSVTPRSSFSRSVPGGLSVAQVSDRRIRF